MYLPASNPLSGHWVTSCHSSPRRFRSLPTSRRTAPRQIVHDLCMSSIVEVDASPHYDGWCYSLRCSRIISCSAIIWIRIYFECSGDRFVLAGLNHSVRSLWGFTSSSNMEVTLLRKSSSEHTVFPPKNCFRACSISGPTPASCHPRPLLSTN